MKKRTCFFVAAAHSRNARMRDAFEALATNAARRGGGARGGDRSSTSASRFVVCPTCSKHVALFSINDHLDGCAVGDDDVVTTTKTTRKATTKATKIRERAEKAPSLPRVIEHRGRRAHTGKTTTGYVPSDALEGGWLDRARRRRRDEGGGDEEEERASHDAFAEMTRAAKRLAKVPLSGHFLLENFITEDEERDIVNFIDDDTVNPWKDSSFNGAHEGKRYGVEVNLAKRVVERARFAMPAILRRLVIERFARAHETLRNFEPNECNAINYLKSRGSVLLPHCDDRQLSSDILVNLSLNADCVMTYTDEKHPTKKIRVHLPRRSLQIQSGSVRYDYQHSINNEDLLGERRVSVTFRESGVVKSVDRTRR